MQATYHTDSPAPLPYILLDIIMLNLNLQSESYRMQKLHKSITYIFKRIFEHLLKIK